jgi:hypothetical protein
LINQLLTNLSLFFTKKIHKLKKKPISLSKRRRKKKHKRLRFNQNTQYDTVSQTIHSPSLLNKRNNRKQRSSSSLLYTNRDSLFSSQKSRSRRRGKISTSIEFRFLRSVLNFCWIDIRIVNFGLILILCDWIVELFMDLIEFLDCVIVDLWFSYWISDLCWWRWG